MKSVTPPKISYLMAVPVTAAVLLLSTAVLEFPYFSADIKFKGPSINELWQEDSNANTQITFSALTIFQKLDTLQKFASRIIENSKNIEPEFVEIVDRYFRDLI